jgi:hypothetical protein
MKSSAHIGIRKFTFTAVLIMDVFFFFRPGKFVARSKMIRLNSLKKSDYEVIADIRRKEVRLFIIA